MFVSFCVLFCSVCYQFLNHPCEILKVQVTGANSRPGAVEGIVKNSMCVCVCARMCVSVHD